MTGKSKNKKFRFVYDSDHEYAIEHKLIAQYLSDAASQNDSYYQQISLKDTQVGSEVARLSPASLCNFAVALCERLQRIEGPYREQMGRSGISTANAIYKTRAGLLHLIHYALRKKLPFTIEQLQVLWQWFSDSFMDQSAYYSLPSAGIVKALRDFVDCGEEIAAIKENVLRVAKSAQEASDRDVNKMGDRIFEIIGLAPELSIQEGEAWSDVAIEFISGLPKADKANWTLLIKHCTKVNGGKPTKKWSNIALDLVIQLNAEAVIKVVPTWFSLVDKPRTVAIEEWSEWEPDPNQMIDFRNADILKGLVWTCGLIGDDRLAIGVGRLAMSAYRKVPGVGPRATKVGNACVWALGQIPGESSLAALAILKVRVKYKPAQKGITAALVVAADRAGMTPEELEEIGVPAYGMTEVGIRRETLGDYKAVLQVLNAKKVALTWVNSAGKAIKTVPKSVRENFTDELKELRQAGKDIAKMLSAQRERLDNLFLHQRNWKYEDWLERYIKHPLVGTMGQRLIWSFEQDGQAVAGMWSKGGVTGANGAAPDIAIENSTVRLWHPVGEDVDSIVAWRNWLEQEEITQPFKQAHREIYLLTEAEENTELYSNRYASHIVKQHQFNALCAARGWQHSLRLMVDDEYEPPTKILPEWGLRAEFWVEGVGEDYGTDTTEAGSYLYLATDQVRFYREEAATNSAHAGGGGYSMHAQENDLNTPLALRDIDPLAFSEVFRDVDLFVGVASVGNDPNWSDGGPEGRYVDYWNSFSFGELSESAETRKTTLENLIPRLKIRDQCEIHGRFLHVKGDIKTYKIHLGSGNVLMKPNDEYLCIVAAQGKAAKTDSIFLPFEGDNRMAVILSKAFLLADDAKIKDVTILSQINRKTQ